MTNCELCSELIDGREAERCHICGLDGICFLCLEDHDCGDDCEDDYDDE